MLYLTLEKAPEVKGSGPWMGVVQGEEQVDSDYPEDEKVRNEMRCRPCSRDVSPTLRGNAQDPASTRSG